MSPKVRANCAAALAALLLGSTPPIRVVAAEPIATNAATCSGLSSQPVHFGSITPSLDRGTFEALVVVSCPPHVSYRLRITSRNDCRMIGPKSEEIEYDIFLDPAYKTVALNCEGFPVELDGIGITTFHLYARTRKRLLKFAAGLYSDQIYMDVLKDKDDR